MSFMARFVPHGTTDDAKMALRFSAQMQYQFIEFQFVKPVGKDQ